LGGDGGPKKPPVNMVPFVITIFIVGIAIFAMAQSSWIGQLQKRGPVVVDPMDKISWMEARQMLHSRIDEGLKAVGATGKYTWASQGQPADINTAGPVELTIDTELADPASRRQIIDPHKELMSKAQVPTLTMNETKSHATWTYTVQAPAVQPAGESAAPTQ